MLNRNIFFYKSVCKSFLSSASGDGRFVSSIICVFVESAPGSWCNKYFNFFNCVTSTFCTVGKYGSHKILSFQSAVLFESLLNFGELLTTVHCKIENYPTWHSGFPRKWILMSVSCLIFADLSLLLICISWHEFRDPLRYIKFIKLELEWHQVTT